MNTILTQLHTFCIQPKCSFPGMEGNNIRSFPPVLLSLIGHKSIIIAVTTLYHTKNRDVVMLVKFECYSDGKYWCGRWYHLVDIFTQGKNLDDLMASIRDRPLVLIFEEAVIKGECTSAFSQISETRSVLLPGFPLVKGKDLRKLPSRLGFTGSLGSGAVTHNSNA